MKIHQYLSIALLISFSSCGSSKDTTTAEKPAPVVNQTTENSELPPATTSSTISSTTAQSQMTETNQDQEKQAATKYRLILSFISIGEGTDATARGKMDAILNKWESKAGKKIVMESFPWGREGEVDFCFLLNELSAPDQAALAREMRETFQMQPLVQISEYQESMHKR